ncbi:MAG: hypothetical protein ACYTBR_02310 [Planctomycetota bacterium]|jgi:hypothetical protein
MSQRELLELAALDALGLLDEFEAAYYTRSFHDAPATVQDEIKRLQAELATDQRLLPGDEPDPGLRERVLRAVAQAIERDESRLAPLATIGRRRGGEPRGESGFRLRASGQFWRAACFVLAGVAVVFALFWVQAQNYVNALSEIAYIDNTERVLEDLIGPTFKTYLFDPETEFVRLMPEQTGSEIRGLICINEQTGRAFLVTDGLAQAGGDAYTLSIQEDDSGARDLRRFGSTGGAQGFPLGTVQVTALAAAQWKILDAAGTVILSSA